MTPLRVVTHDFEQRGHKALLASLLLLIFSSSFLQDLARLTWVISAFVVLVLLAAVMTVTSRGRQFHVALVLAALALIPQFGLLWKQPFWLQPLHYLATVSFLAWVIFLLLRDIVVRSHTVTRELLLGAINVYLMLGLAFAFLFNLLEHLSPGSFTGLEALADNTALDLKFIYFSFVTLTTLGYGDVSPLTANAMTFASAEAIAGQLYLTILVARLVGLYIVRPQDGN